MKCLSGILVVTAIISAAAQRAYAEVCLDEAGISGYHIPPEKEAREAYAVVIGTVVGVKEGPAPLEGEEGEGTVYQLRVEETLRGHRRKTFALFSENTSARFPMEVGRTYLVFVHKRDKTFFATNCGSSGELSERSQLLGQLRKTLTPGRKG
jgi:hypothetical protein